MAFCLLYTINLAEICQCTGKIANNFVGDSINFPVKDEICILRAQKNRQLPAFDAHPQSAGGFVAIAWQQ
jgi:hypothetical protein